jgi:hypothetical protein
MPAMTDAPPSITASLVPTITIVTQQHRRTRDSDAANANPRRQRAANANTDSR